MLYSKLSQPEDTEEEESASPQLAATLNASSFDCMMSSCTFVLKVYFVDNRQAFYLL